VSAIDAITHQPVAGDVVINGLVVGFANVAVGILRIAGKPDIRLDWAPGA
jgi:hypothetical protein